MERQITSPPGKIEFINDVLVGGSQNYLIGLKWVFRFKVGEFLPHEMQNIILHEARFNLCIVSTQQELR